MRGGGGSGMQCDEGKSVKARKSKDREGMQTIKSEYLSISRGPHCSGIHFYIGREWPYLMYKITLFLIKISPFLNRYPKR